MYTRARRICLSLRAGTRSGGEQNPAAIAMEVRKLRYLFLSALVSTALSQRDAYTPLTEYAEEYQLPSLPYAYDALEPYVDEATLRVHHLGHHKAYTTKMNAALKNWRETVSCER